MKKQVVLSEQEYDELVAKGKKRNAQLMQEKIDRLNLEVGELKKKNDDLVIKQYLIGLDHETYRHRRSSFELSKNMMRSDRDAANARAKKAESEKKYAESRLFATGLYGLAVTVLVLILAFC